MRNLTIKENKFGISSIEVNQIKIKGLELLPRFSGNL